MRKTSFLLSPVLAVLLTTAAVAEDKSVRIGVLTDLSGVYADITGEGSIVAARMAVEDFGAADKGITVDIVSADHQNKPDVASTMGRTWYDVEGVDMIVDVPGSAPALAIAALAHDKNKVGLFSAPGVSDLTGSACTPNTIHWTYDSWSQANGTARATVELGYDSWFFIAVDSAVGHALQNEAGSVVEANGGKVLGGVRHPFPGSDFSSFLLQAQASGAKVIGLANAGADTINSIKQAAEFGITASGQHLAAMFMYISDVRSLGLEAAQGLMFTTAFYWDLNDSTRDFSQRFAERNGGRMPTQTQAGTYSAVTHYLKAVEASEDPHDGAAVVAKMKEIPREDLVFGKGEIRADGRELHDMYLVQVKTPEESSGEWDYYRVLATIPASEAFRPMAEGDCPLVRGLGN